VGLVLLGLVLLGLTTAIGLLLSRGKELCIARQVRLRVTGAERHLVIGFRRSAGIILAVIAEVIAHIGSALGPEERSGLPELLLGSRDQAQIMLGVLVVILRRNRIARRLRVARKLEIFLGDMRPCAADFDVGSVRFVDPGEWIVALAVSPPHTLVLTVSHGLRVRQPLIEAAKCRRFLDPKTLNKARPGCSPRQARASSAGLRDGAPKPMIMNFKLDPFRRTPRCCPPSITITATPVRPRQYAQPMKHPDPKRGAGNHTMMISTTMMSSVRLNRTNCLAEPRSGPCLQRAI
jgi:hypothetical protein